MTETLDIDDVPDNGDYLLFEEEFEELDEPEVEEVEFDVVDHLQTINQMKSSIQKKTMMPYLTKYEKARIIGLRSQQLAKGAAPLVEVGNLKNVIDIAEKELKERKVPLIVRRNLPNGKYEDWRIEEFII